MSAAAISAEIDRPSLIRMIVGRELGEEYIKTNAPTDETGFEVVGTVLPGKIEDISFSARKGEIFGIYGLMGSGRTEIFNCLFGLDKPDAGTMRLRRAADLRLEAGRCDEARASRLSPRTAS